MGQTIVTVLIVVVFAGFLAYSVFEKQIAKAIQKKKDAKKETRNS